MGGTDLILLDTHVVIWLDQGARELGDKARDAIQEAYERERVFVSAISFWEVAMLTSKGRLRMPGSVTAWRRELLDTGVQELAVTGDVGVLAVELAGLHGDPADRMIVATAKAFGATLLTADDRMLAWPGNIPRLDARQ